MDFRSLPSWFKLAAWAAAVAGTLALMQAGMWLLNWSGNVLESGTPLLVVSLLTLLLLMSLDRRPLADYGAIVGPTWKRLFLWGLAAGIVTYAAYLGLSVGLGAYSPRISEVGPARLAKAALAGLATIPLAATQQFIFSGYLLAMLRDRCSRLVAVLISSALFAVLNRIEDLPSFVEPHTQRLLLGLFLTAGFLSVLRLLTGSILVSTGLLAGWLMVRRVAGRLLLLQAVPDSPYYDWLSGGDPRQAPVMAFLLGTAFVTGWILLLRRGEGKVALSEQALHADFKRVFPFSHPQVLVPLDIWLGRLVAARFQVGMDYLPRLLVILTISAVNTLLTLPERLILPWLLRRRRVLDPVFILGVHRSGTTHLHNLLALDPQFTTPRTFHVMNPHGCVFSGWLLVPVWCALMPWKRPMDNVPFHLFSAQEEDFAVAGACGLSPQWGLTFPRQWPYYDRFIYPDKLDTRQRRQWQQAYHQFLQKLTFWSPRRPLLKSPHNTGRAAALHTLYPNAKFIHICRHPYDVYRSNMHIVREGHVVLQLQDPDPETSYEARFLDNYEAMESAWEADARQLPVNQRVEVRFEDLEQDPLAVVRHVYQQLDLHISPEFQRRLARYVADQADYRKNRHHALDEADQRRIDARMGRFLRAWGYLPDTPAEDRHAA
ncbi:MAG: sulfotransferase [Pirellulaceae bacterium]|nr:sulfotransferase [Pirellulaceae bacterium]